MSLSHQGQRVLFQIMWLFTADLLKIISFMLKSLNLIHIGTKNYGHSQSRWCINELNKHKISIWWNWYINIMSTLLMLSGVRNCTVIILFLRLCVFSTCFAWKTLYNQTFPIFIMLKFVCSCAILFDN